MLEREYLKAGLPPPQMIADEEAALAGAPLEEGDDDLILAGDSPEKEPVAAIEVKSWL